METYDKQYEPLVTSKTLFDTLYEEQNPGDLIALYMHYYYVAKWQATNTAWSTTGYTANALNWSVGKVRQTKKVLLSLGLIKDVISQNKDGKFGKSYIYVRFMFSDEKVQEAKEIANQTALRYHRTPVKVEANALRAGRLNALSSNSVSPTPLFKASINRPKRTNNSPEWKQPNLPPVRPVRETIPHLNRFPANYQASKEFQSIWSTYVRHREENKKLFKCVMTEDALKLIINAINKNFIEDIDQVIERFEWCITNGKIAPNLKPWVNKVNMQAHPSEHKPVSSKYANIPKTVVEV